MLLKPFKMEMLLLRGRGRFQVSSFFRLSAATKSVQPKFYSTLGPSLNSSNSQQAKQQDIKIETKCEPTEKLLKLIEEDKDIEEKVKRIQREFQIYEYFSSYVPTIFLDKHWIYLLRTTSILSRVSYFWFMGITESRQNDDQQREAEERAKREARIDRESKKFHEGGMGYGKQFYALMYNPTGQFTQYNRPFHLWNALASTMASELPKLLFDCQFIPSQTDREYRMIKRAVKSAYFENVNNRHQFPCAFINADMDEPFTRNMFARPVNPSVDREPFSVLTDKFKEDPFHDPKEQDPGKQVIYLSHYASEMIDGPLIHKAYVIPFTGDYNKESIGAIRRGNYRAMCLPIRKYVKWRYGPMKLPFAQIVKILREVAANGGDWASALEMHIRKRNLRSLEENKERVTDVRYSNMREERRKRADVTHTIFETLGTQPAVFDAQSRQSASIRRYASSLEHF